MPDKTMSIRRGSMTSSHSGKISGACPKSVLLAACLISFLTGSNLFAQTKTRTQSLSRSLPKLSCLKSETSSIPIPLVTEEFFTKLNRVSLPGRPRCVDEGLNHALIGPGGMKVNLIPKEDLETCESLIDSSFGGGLVCTHAYVLETTALINTRTGRVLGYNIPESRCIQMAKSTASQIPFYCSKEGTDVYAYSKRSPHKLFATKYSSVDECAEKGTAKLLEIAQCSQIQGCEALDLVMTFQPLREDSQSTSPLPRLFEPLKSLPVHEKPLAQCQENTRGGRLHGSRYADKIDANHLILPECSQDVLYAWFHPSRIGSLVDELKSKPHDNLSKTLWMSTSPSGSFGYGEVPVRIKLKTNVRIQRNELFGNSCDALRGAGVAINNQVIVRESAQGFDEYIVCSADVVESISTDSPEIYNEIVQDLVWKDTHPSSQYICFARGVDGDCRDVNSRLDSHLGTDFSSAALLKRLEDLRHRAGKEREVVFSTGSPQDRSAHFQRKPIYFPAGP